MTAAQNFVQPARHSTADGNTRRVGFELEFSGIEFLEVVGLAADSLDAEARVHSQAEATIEAAGLGKFTIEVDSELAKSLAQRWAELHSAEPDQDPLGEWAISLATELVPVEVVCPPVALDRLHELSQLVSTLRERGALGTSGSVLYAFGLHINPELPALSPALIATYLKAYAVAQGWLVRMHEVDFTRRLTPYIDLYPDEYLALALAYDDSVSQQQLIDDYLAHNATRNRALDMLPLFKYLDEKQIVERVDDSRINARPTFHYRLPNCDIDKPDWNLAKSWNIWCVLEALVEDAELLERLAHQSRKYEAPFIKLTEEPWFSELDELHAALISG